MNNILKRLEGLDFSLHVEIYLFREPSHKEINEIISECKKLCRIPIQQQELSLKNLAHIFINPLSQQKLSTFKQSIEEKRPVLFWVSMISKDGKIHQKCTVKLPFADERADKILGREYKQLSRKEYGLVTIDISGLPVNLKQWIPLIERRLQPNLYRRIGAVLLIKQSIAENALKVKTNLIVHPNPLNPLPDGFLQLVNAYS